MAKKVKVVLNRNAFSSEVLHEAVKPVMDTDRSNVVATCPAAVEGAHGVLTQMIGKVVA